MRIISGSAKRRSIVAPKGSTTRPTQDYIRESLFNILQGEVSGSLCFDVFAGSGALGLEALSRGAEYCLFCDKSFQAIQAIRENLASLRFEPLSHIIKGDYQRAIDYAAAQGLLFDLAFIDPPYAFAAVEDLLERLKPVLRPGALLIIERDKDTAIPNSKQFQYVTMREYGITAIHIYRYEVA